MKAASGSHHRNHLALSSLFWWCGEVANWSVLFNYRICSAFFLERGKPCIHIWGERTALALPGEVCWCCNLFLSTSTGSLLPWTTLSVSDVDRHSIQNCLLFLLLFFFLQTCRILCVFLFWSGALSQPFIQPTYYWSCSIFKHASFKGSSCKLSIKRW